METRLLLFLAACGTLVLAWMFALARTLGHRRRLKRAGMSPGWGADAHSSHMRSLSHIRALASQARGARNLLLVVTLLALPAAGAGLSALAAWGAARAPGAGTDLLAATARGRVELARPDGTVLCSVDQGPKLRLGFRVRRLVTPGWMKRELGLQDVTFLEAVQAAEDPAQFLKGNVGAPPRVVASWSSPWFLRVFPWRGNAWLPGTEVESYGPLRLSFEKTRLQLLRGGAGQSAVKDETRDGRKSRG